MAAVDSLLRLMILRSADLLVISGGKVPLLRRSGELSPLSMPALDASLVAGFVDEVLPADKREKLNQGGVLDTVYKIEDGASFVVKVERTGTGESIKLTFRPAGAGAPATSAASSAPAAPAGATRTAPPIAAPDSHKVPLLPVRQSSVRQSPSRAEALGQGSEPAAALGSEPLRESTLQPVLQAMPHATDEVWEPVWERAGYERATDIVLSSGHAPRMRVAGQFIELEGPLCTDELILALVAPVLGESGLAVLEAEGSMDLALSVASGVRFRVNVFRQHGGLAAALRPIRRDIPSLRELSLPEHLTDLTSYSNGLMLVCGPAGSGKSTTLVALVEHINRTRARHIVTLEDPIEYQYVSQRALIHQRELGTHVPDFELGLRAALRESPDVIVVGEMRDRATIAAALTAAETGHLVMGTLHASSGVMAIDRIIDVFPENKQRQVRLQLASVLRAVLTQFLLPGTSAERRVPGFEKMIVTSAIANQIREDKTHLIPSQILTGRNEGMVPLERTLVDLVRAGRITLESARAVAHDHDYMRQLLHQ